MEIKEIAIGGIDRHTPTQDAPLGVCEELINVRPGPTGLEVYGEGTAISGSLNLSDIHIHRWGGQPYYIGIDPSGNVVRFSLDGTTQQTLQWVSSPDNVDIKSIGNMLIVSDKGENEADPTLKTYVLEENDGVMSYTPLNRDSIPMPGMERKDITVTPFSAMGSTCSSSVVPYDEVPDQDVRTPARRLFNFIEYVSDTIDWVSFREQMKATLRATFNRITALDKHLAHGYVLVGTSVTLYDGTETAFGNLLCVDMSPRTPYRDAGNLPTPWKILRTDNHYTYVVPQKDSLDGLFVHYLTYGRKAYWGLMPDGGDLGGTAATSSYFTTLTPKISIPSGYSDLKEYIKSVSLWVSRPYDKIDWDTFVLRMGHINGSFQFEEYVPAAGEDLYGKMSDNQYHLYPFAHIRRLSECREDMHRQLLFRQKEWSLDEIEREGGSVTFDCEFGTSEGTLGDTLTVDAWNSKRAGDMFVYNNRIHMFDSVVKVEVPDSDLQCLSGWDDEWYIDRTVSGSQSGEFWHMKWAPDYSSRADDMRDITLTQASQTTSRKGALGLYHDSTPTDSEDADSYTWYYCYKSTDSDSRFSFYLLPRSGGDWTYVFLSMDRTTLTKDTANAKYMALATSSDVHNPGSLSWYNVPQSSWEESALRKSRLCNVIAYLKQDSSQLVIRHSNIPVLFRYTQSGSGVATLGTVANLSGLLTYPDRRCERLVIQYGEGGSVYTWETAMGSEDSSYNFSYAYVGEGSAEFVQGTENTDAEKAVYEERDTVVVSALNNPTVFPVEQSYRFVGEVTGMALALEELNSLQTGTYPVYVLTERGVFALNQGSGGVLYASVTPVTTDNCVKGKSVQVHRGVVYVANGRIYWLVGRKRTDILLPLDGYPDEAPRGNSGYTLGCRGTLYNVSGLLSDGYIEDYLDGASLGYDSFHDELLVSNPDEGYTYVFSFASSRWFKISGTFGSMDDHHLLTRATGDDSLEILDMTQENLDGEQTIHIQTRPMKLTPMAFGVIQRTIARVRATLSQSQSLSVYLFTSDNLEDYTCAAAQQRTNCTIDRIRLERTAHARKYTVLVIGGKVPHDTELSTVLCQVKVNAPRKIR